MAWRSSGNNNTEMVDKLKRKFSCHVALFFCLHSSEVRRGLYFPALGRMHGTLLMHTMMFWYAASIGETHRDSWLQLISTSMRTVTMCRICSAHRFAMQMLCASSRIRSRYRHCNGLLHYFAEEALGYAHLRLLASARSKSDLDSWHAHETCVQ